jgi:trimethylamine:corrinoid methyltransferase-like protein
VDPKGNYLAQEHTLRCFQEEFWFPMLREHDNYDAWLAKGSKSLVEKAH